MSAEEQKTEQEEAPPVDLAAPPAPAPVDVEEVARPPQAADGASANGGDGAADASAEEDVVDAEVVDEGN